MFTLLIVFHVLACFSIIGVVLLQAGKGADIGSAFGGAGSQAVFGSMGTPTFLGKITTGIAALFMVTSFALAIIGGERTGTSVIREPAAATTPAPPAATSPAAPAAAPSQPAPAKSGPSR